LGSFNPKQSNEDSVTKIESSMSAKMERLLQSAKANFLRDSSGRKDPERCSWGAAVSSDALVRWGFVISWWRLVSVFSERNCGYT
jgi:hypothetical protein